VAWCASSPHHVTSIFVPVYTSSYLSTGSLGVGIAVEPRFETCVPGDKPLTTSTMRRTASILRVEEHPSIIRAPLPPAKGYAVSAASAVTYALATAPMNGLSYMDALRAAHRAEIEERTGLGDVLSVSCGIGVVIRYQPGAPGIGRTDCISFPSSIELLVVELGESMHTRELLRQRYIEYGRDLALNSILRIRDDKTVESFIEESQRFTEQMKLLATTGIDKEFLSRLPGLIGYYVKKKLLVLFIEADQFLDARDILLAERYHVRRLMPSEHGPRVWWSDGYPQVSSEISLADDKGKDS